MKNLLCVASAAAIAGILLVAGFSTPLSAQENPVSAEGRIQNSTAVFSGLDKITGRIVAFDVRINETVQFGALQVTPHVCYTRPPTEKQETLAFVEIDEITLDKKIQALFRGWFIEDSPGLSAVEHPIYDVWLVNCKDPQT